MEYCTFKTNCYSLGTHKATENTDNYICCFTCPKYKTCSISCKDREGGKVCALVTNISSIQSFTSKQAFNQSLPKKSDTTEKTVEKKQTASNIPQKLTDLSILLNVPYSKVYYLSKDKKMTNEEIYEKLKEGKKCLENKRVQIW